MAHTWSLCCLIIVVKIVVILGDLKLKLTWSHSLAILFYFLSFPQESWRNFGRFSPKHNRSLSGNVLRHFPSRRQRREDSNACSFLVTDLLVTNTCCKISNFLFLHCLSIYFICFCFSCN